MSNFSQVNPDLVCTARFEPAGEEARHPAETLHDLEMCHGSDSASVIAHDASAAVPAVPHQRQIDPARVRRRNTLGYRKIPALDMVRPEERLERAQGARRGHQKDGTRRLPVKSMNDAYVRTLEPMLARKISSCSLEQAVAFAFRSWLGQYSGGLVND
jgi:hypothetical protein